MSLDPERFRTDFPLLKQKNAPIYFDNACMTLKPQQVIDAMNAYYTEFPGCGGRSNHSISRRVDEEVRSSRKSVKQFIGAKKEEEIIFTRNTTESINLVARSLKVKKGDVILTSDKEHNSNLLPWQMLSQRKGLCHEIIHTDEDNSFNMGRFEDIIERNRVRIIALGHTANLDGVSIPAKTIIKKAHKEGAQVLLDAAQSAPHQELNVKSLGADYVAFSGHKMLGPSGTGILYGKKEALETLSPYTVGGETVINSRFDDATWEQLPARFEGGLQNYSGIIGLRAAINYLNTIGMKNIQQHEEKLNRHITDQLIPFNNISLIGPTDHKKRSGIFSFQIKGMDHHEAAGILDANSKIMVRSGMHCVHSWFNHRRITGSIRASVYLYNTLQEAEVFTEKIKELIGMTKS